MLFYRNVLKSVLFLLILVPAQLSAQGIFQSFGFPKTVTATGQTEVLGSVDLALKLGPTGADTLVIDVSPFQITNSAASDIAVAAAGNITVGAVTIDVAAGQVKVPINAGGTSGSIRVDGIRAAVAGTNASSITARFSFANHSNFFDGRDSVVVADQVRTGLAVDPMTDNFRIFANVVTKNSATLVVREGYPTAFFDSRQFGQNTSTRVRIRISDFPGGLQMLFPATVTSQETAATLTTLEGTAVQLPRSDGTTEVTYSFTGAANSNDILESFKIPFTVSTNGPVEILQPTIEVSLAPIGAAVPTAALPSTNVLRYAEENLLALAGSSRIITKTLYWNGIDASRKNVLSLFNGGSRVANVTLTAFSADGQVITGTNVTNPNKQSLPANQSANLNLVDLFGPASPIAAVRVDSTSTDLLALAAVSASGGSQFLSLVDTGLSNFVIPILSEETRISVFNPGTAAVTGTLVLRGQNGAMLGTATLGLGANASDTRSVRDMFGTVSSGQVVGSFSVPVVALVSFGSALNFVAARAPNFAALLYVPFLVTGAGYETDLNVMNASDRTITITAQALSNQGAAIGSPQPITLAPSQQVSTASSQLFGIAGFATGYVRLQVPSPTLLGPFSSPPAITGYARIRFGQSASTVLPLAAVPQTQATLLNSGVSATDFQGIVLLNPKTTAAAVTLQALNSMGAVIATTTVNVDAGQVVSKQLLEYFTANIPEGSVIRVASPAGIVATTIVGSKAGDTLRSAPGQ